MGKVIKGIGQVLLSPIGAAVGLFGGKKQSAPATTPATPVMPMADDEQVRRTKRASIAKQMARGGRSSTILTSGSDTLGGGYG